MFLREVFYKYGSLQVWNDASKFWMFHYVFQFHLLMFQHSTVYITNSNICVDQIRNSHFGKILLRILQWFLYTGSDKLHSVLSKKTRWGPNHLNRRSLRTILGALWCLTDNCALLSIQKGQLWNPSSMSNLPSTH